MSWKSAGALVTGSTTRPSVPPPSSSIAKRYPSNLGGRTVFERERELAARYGGPEQGVQQPGGRTEWDIVRENHRFIRDDEEPADVSWEERLARAYESKLFKEYALIDLKHYKSHRFALRWRTAPEVIDGLGETTCGSLRCKYHPLPLPSPVSPAAVVFGLPGPAMDSERPTGFESADTSTSIHRDNGDGSGRRKGKRKDRKEKKEDMPRLRSFELPFVYQEAGTRREAMVKVRLCPRCESKLKWKPGRQEGREARTNERKRDTAAAENTELEDNESSPRHGHGEEEMGREEEARSVPESRCRDAQYLTRAGTSPRPSQALGLRTRSRSPGNLRSRHRHYNMNKDT